MLVPSEGSGNVVLGKRPQLPTRDPRPAHKANGGEGAGGGVKGGGEWEKGGGERGRGCGRLGRGKLRI